jgi:hypothetical protein
MIVRSHVTRYGSPDTRKVLEHDETDCAACKAAGGMAEGDVIYVVVEYPDGREEIRRIEGLGPAKAGLTFVPEYASVAWSSKDAPFVNGCRAVTREEADAEIALAHAEGRVS